MSAVKYSKKSVDYTDDHGTSSEQCSKCVHYILGKACEIVEGRILPEGWCNQFKRKDTSMARLTAAKRKALPASQFALGKGHYPINDPAHARNALARVSQFGSSSQKAKVRAAVRRKYPGIKQGGGERKFGTLRTD
jgi:hypothetical protein